ncbi:MAG: inositol monophosphatase family protein [Acidobacteriota bacterium]|jgi:myo-inositol-1(or 4)-monophosphatase
MSDLMETAVEAARIGGRILLEGRRRRPATVQDKGSNDFVTDVDRRSEEAIVEYIRGRHPDHSIVAEEGADWEGSSGYRWLVDPLDGTTNYIHDYPCFAVSVGVWRGREGIAGAVLDPLREELFHAERGSGAWLGERRIHVSGASGLAGSLLVTGFPFREIDRLDAYLRSFRELFRRSAGIRRDGSAALDLCSVACGRLDGFWELGLSPWDLAAGIVIVNEAGGTVTDHEGTPEVLERGNVVAAPAGLHREMLEVLEASS